MAAVTGRGGGLSAHCACVLADLFCRHSRTSGHLYAAVHVLRGQRRLHRLHSAFLAALEVPDSVLELFVLVDPRWDARSKRLLVSPALERDPEGWGRVVLMILVCRRWVGWSETRWARFGRAGRFFLRSLATSLDEAVAQSFADETCSNYNLGGFRSAGVGAMWRAWARPQLIHHTGGHYDTASAEATGGRTELLYGDIVLRCILDAIGMHDMAAPLGWGIAS